MIEEKENDFDDLLDVNEREIYSEKNKNPFD
jgi:hypothetical protein